MPFAHAARLSRCPIQTGLAVLACLAALAANAIFAPVASAQTNPVLQQCSSGTLTGSYSIGQLQQALGLLTAEQNEYTSCQDVIQRALGTAIANSHARGRADSSDSGSFLPTRVVIIVVVLALAAVTFGAIAIRRRRISGDH